MLEQASKATTAMSLEKGLQRRWRLGEKLIESWILLAGILTIVVLLGIIALLLKEGLPAFWYTPPWEFFFGTKWYPVSEPPTFGIMPFFVATLWITLVATAISVPIGVACAAYLAEVAPAKVRETVKPIIEILAGIPSVVMGFIGLMLLSPLVQSIFNLNTGLSGFTAGIMLSLMSLPIIISVSEDALRAVPDDFRQAAYALGSTKWETIWHVSIPGALSGITWNSPQGLPTEDKSLEYGGDVLMLPSTEEGVNQVASNPNAIFYPGLGYVTEEVKPIAVKKMADSAGVLPSVQTALDGTYPIARPLLFYTDGTPTGVIKAFVDYCRSSDGQGKVTEVGYVPLK